MALHQATGLCATGTAPPTLNNLEHWIAWHLTHQANLTSIAMNASLLPDNAVRASVDIGEPEIKAKRRLRATGLHGEAVVADYVPFYWTARSPMMFREVNYGAGEYSGGADGLVLLGVVLNRVIGLDLPFCISDGNASVAITQFSETLAGAKEILTLEPLLDAYWQATLEYPDKPRQRQAELLVHGAVPLTAVDFVVAAGPSPLKAAEAVLAPVMPHAQFVTRPQFFYR